MYAIVATASNASLLSFVTDGIGTVLGWVGTTVTAITGSTGALKELAPLFAIGISISAILLGVKIVKSVVWGA